MPERGARSGGSGGGSIGGSGGAADRPGADGPGESRPADSSPEDALTRSAIPAAGDQLARARAALAAARTAAGPAAAQARGRARAGGRGPGESQLTGPELGITAPGGPGAGGPGADAAPPGTGQDGAARPASSRAARRVRRDDPQSLGSAIDDLLDAEGWNLAAATGSVFGRWPQIVGTDLAAHTSPESLREGELTVIADSTAWATQLRLLQAQLIRRLNTELGDGTVLRVKIRGPVTVIRKPGEWRVRGSRGPRDTYG